ncbi:hypothetical protein SPFM15_00011 [Salmonella phage SPFM15]|nr:hypothetical protein SPFM14_00004 [Salmonella phage SPFM14]VFR13635.1 hypothetical protein SPFM15_00011 [Salmonella phage SPFM15]
MESLKELIQRQRDPVQQLMYKNRIQALVSQLNKQQQLMGQIETMIRQSQVVANMLGGMAGEFDEEAAVEEEEFGNNLGHYGISNSRLMMRNRRASGHDDLVISWLLAMWLLLSGELIDQILGLVERNGRIDHRKLYGEVFTTALRLSADLLRERFWDKFRKYIGFSTDQDKRDYSRNDELYKEFHRGPVGSPLQLQSKVRDLHRRLYVKVTQNTVLILERRSTGSSVADAIINETNVIGFAIHLADFMIEYPAIAMSIVNSVTAEYAGKLTVVKMQDRHIIGLDTSEAVGRDKIISASNYVTDWYYTEEQMLKPFSGDDARRMNASRIRAAQGTPDQIRRDFGGEWTTGGYNNHRQLGTTDEELADMIANAPDMIRKGSTAKIPRIMFYVKYTSGISWDERYIDIPTRAQLIFATTPGDLATEEGEYMYSLMASGTAARRINEAEGVPYGNVLFSDEGPFTNNIHHILPAALIGQNDKEAANGVGRGLTAGRDPDNRETFACLAQGNKLITGNKMKQLRNALPDYLWPHHPDLENSRTILITKGPALREETILRQHGKTVGMSALLLWLMRFRGNFSMYWIFFNNIDAAIEFRECVRVPADGVKNGMPFRLDTLEQKAMIVTECAENPWYFFVHLALHNPELRGVDPFSPDLNVHFLQFATTLQGLGVQHWYILRKNDWRHYPGAIVDDVTPPHRVTNLPPPLRGWRYGDCMLDSSHSYGYA